MQQWVERPPADPWGRRLLADGRVEEYSSATAAFAGGEWRIGSQELGWRPLTRLRPDAVERLRAVIRDSGVLELPAEVEPAGTVIGGSDQEWTVALDDRRVQVRLLGVSPDRVPELSALDTALQLAVGEALSRGTA